MSIMKFNNAVDVHYHFLTKKADSGRMLSATKIFSIDPKKVSNQDLFDIGQDILALTVNKSLDLFTVETYILEEI